MKLFLIANVKQLRTDYSFGILLPFFRTSWGVGVLHSAHFNSLHNRVEFSTILEGLRNFGGVEPPKPPLPLGTPLPEDVLSIPISETKDLAKGGEEVLLKCYRVLRIRENLRHL